MSADAISAVADAIVAMVAMVALFMAWRQIQVSREVSALEAYENYHLTSLTNPQFLSGEFPFDEVSVDDREAYCCYVLYALMTGERVMTIFPGNEEWEEAIRDDIRIHGSFIASPHFCRYRKNQTERMTVLINEVLGPPTPAG